MNELSYKFTDKYEVPEFRETFATEKTQDWLYSQPNVEVTRFSFQLNMLEIAQDYSMPTTVKSIIKVLSLPQVYGSPAE